MYPHLYWIILFLQTYAYVSIPIWHLRLDRAKKSYRSIFYCTWDNYSHMIYRRDDYINLSTELYGKIGTTRSPKRFLLMSFILAPIVIFSTKNYGELINLVPYWKINQDPFVSALLGRLKNKKRVTPDGGITKPVQLSLYTWSTINLSQRVLLGKNILATLPQNLQRLLVIRNRVQYLIYSYLRNASVLYRLVLKFGSGRAYFGIKDDTSWLDVPGPYRQNTVAAGSDTADKYWAN